MNKSTGRHRKVSSDVAMNLGVSGATKSTNCFSKSLNSVSNSAPILMPTSGLQNIHKETHSMVLSYHACGSCFHSLWKLIQMNRLSKVESGAV